MKENRIDKSAPWMMQYFVNTEDVYKYTYGSNHKSLMRCPRCGYERIRSIHLLHEKGFACPKCSDGISYPNKFMFNMLEQLKISFLYEVSKTHLGFEWVDKYKYDFYFETIDGQKYFIEMDGHFHEVFEETKQRDDIKDRLAQQHNIQVIRIPCNYNKNRFNFIKNSILNSILPHILKFTESDIDWYQCDKESNSSLLIEACNLWTSGTHSALEISHKLHVCRCTISTYLKRGQKLGLCDYDPQAEIHKALQMATCKDVQNKKCKPIAVFNNSGITHIFFSAKEFSEMSKVIFGVHISRAMITNVCKGLYTSSMGLTFKYITKSEYEYYYNVFKGNVNNTINNSYVCCHNNSKQVAVILNGSVYDVFVNIADAATQMMERFNIRFTYSGIKNVCLGKQQQYKGYNFKHITKEEYEQYKIILNDYEVVYKEVII
ncbi:MAG: hypothetical protein SOY54_02470 [Bacilli bacterium]|nr:hypothetical protein [Bacilli bacterium]